MTPLRQGYPLYNIECQIPDALGNSAFESPHTEVCAPKILISAHKMFAIFVAKIRWQSNPWIFSQGCSDMPCERDTPIFTTWGLLTSIEEKSDFQCCLGWGLLVGCYIEICTQICTRVGLEVNFNVHHICYALHSTPFFFPTILVNPPSISWE